MAAEPRWKAGNHPTPEELLLAREDEMPPAQAEPILAHIHQCWQCRAHVERHKRGVEAYLNFRQAQLDPAAAPRPDGWLRLSARLRAAGGHPAPGRVAMWKRVPKTVWLASSVAAAALLIAAFLIAPAPLTANVVFDRAVRAQTAVDENPALERVLIRRGGQLLAVDNVVLHTARIEPAHPLSVDSFRDWHSSLHSKQDSVTTLGNEISVETTTAEGAIALARLTVARATYRPHAKHVELRDGITIDVETVAAPLPAPSEPTPNVHMTAPAAAPGLSAEQRESLEMEVRWALHRIDADLGEPLAIQAAGERLVVSGTLDDATRRDQIMEALGAFPQVTAQLKVAIPDADLIANAQPIEPGRSTAGPLLTPRLLQDLPDADARRSFVSTALHLSQDILRHSWALRRLADRYPPSAEAALSSDARTSLQQLVAAHQDAISAAAHQAAESWKPYVSLDASSPTVRPWQSAAIAALPRAQSLDHYTVRLLAAGGADSLTLAEALRQLRATLPQEPR